MHKGASLKVLPIAILAFAIQAVSPAAAETAQDETPRGWMLRVGPTWIDSDRDSGVVVGRGGATLGDFGGQDVGLSVAGEYRHSHRVGVEVGVLGTSNTVGVRSRNGVVVASGTSSYAVFTAGPALHLTSHRPADLYVGPLLVFSARTGVGYQRDQWAGVRVGGGFGWGAVLGVDVPVGQGHWLICANVRYLDTNLDGTDGNGDPFDLGLGHTAVGIGFGYRF